MPNQPRETLRIPSITINRLDVTDFRNYAAARLEAHGPVVVLTGPNGAGKTNLLEAISLFAPGRGLRRAAFAAMARMPGAGGWAISAQISGMQGPVRIGAAWQAGGSTGGRKLVIGGKSARSAGQLGRHLRIAWLTPAMDRIFAGPAADRRRFFDRLTATLDPAHAARAAALERLMRQRNRLLESHEDNAAWLDVLEAQMAQSFIAVAAARLAALKALKTGMKTVEKAAGAFPFAALGLQGEVENQLRESPAVQVEDAWRARLRGNRARDAAAGRTLEGPHRTDLEVLHGPGGMPARLCSTGEQKALLIAIVLAHARAVRAQAGGHAPVMLLDEVAAHLDRARRRGLFAALEELQCQAWMTGTETDLFEDLRGRAHFVRIEDGQVAAAC